MTLSSPLQKDGVPLWRTSYPLNVDWHADISARVMHHSLDEAAEKWGDSTYLRFMGRNWSYGAVRSAAERLARGLQDRGVVKGTRVGICMPNMPSYVIAIFGILKAGGVVVNFNPLMSEQGFERQIRDSGAEIMVTVNLGLILPKIDAVAARAGLKKIIVCDLLDELPFPTRMMARAVVAAKRLTGKSQLVQMPRDALHEPLAAVMAAKDAPAPVEVTPDDTALLQYTLGTTGRPKGVLLSHASMMSFAQQMVLWFKSDRLSNEVPVALLFSPLFDSSSTAAYVGGGLLTRGTVVLIPKPEPEPILKAIERERPNILAGIPFMYQSLLDHPRCGKTDMSSLELVVSGGYAAPATLYAGWNERTGIEITEFIYACETFTSCCNPMHGVRKLNSIGLPLPCVEVRFVDLKDPDREVAQGETGQLCVRGPQVMRGYWNRPDLMAHAFDKDKFFRTGDAGYMDKDGYSFIIDRMDDIVTDAEGRFIFPRRIEDAAFHHPAVADICAAGVQRKEGREIVKAWIVLKPGAQADAAAIMEFLKDKIAAHEMPREIAFLPALPKTIRFKPDRVALRAADGDIRTEA